MSELIENIFLTSVIVIRTLGDGMVPTSLLE